MAEASIFLEASLFGRGRPLRQRQSSEAYAGLRGKKLKTKVDLQVGGRPHKSR